MFTRLRKGYAIPATPGNTADDLDTVMPGPHLIVIASLLKRWTAGTLHYRISHEHLPYYPRRVHLPVQPAHLQGQRNALSTDCCSRP